MVLQGHSGQVKDLLFSEDGSTLFSCGGDRTIKVWDTATGLQRFTFREHGSAVNGISLSSDGKLLASCSRDGTVRFWKGASGKKSDR